MSFCDRQAIPKSLVQQYGSNEGADARERRRGYDNGDSGGSTIGMEGTNFESAFLSLELRL